MALYHTTVLDNQIKALPTVSTASGSVATFDTDMTENLIEVKCQIVPVQTGSGTPSPSNPRPITVYTSLNLSHSGSDTSNPTVYNIPFGQTVAKGLLNVGTGKLTVTHACVSLDSSLNWMKNESILTSNAFVASTQFPNYKRENGISSHFETVSSSAASSGIFFGVGINILTPLDMNLSTSNDFKQWISNNTVQVLYSLLTPQEIQLDSITLQALLNENNIWCDTNGDTSVKYILSVGKAIS